MPRLRHCKACSETATADHPDWRPARMFGGGSVYHRLDKWPHESFSPRSDAPAIHDDASFRRAYTGKREHGNSDMFNGLGRDFETRQDHNAYLKANHIVEAGIDTPTRAGPKPLDLARKRGLFREAVHKAKRGL